MTSGRIFYATLNKMENLVTKPFVRILLMELSRVAMHFRAMSLYYGSTANGL
jgi:hypothetical protein